MSPVPRSVHMWNFSQVNRDEIQKNKTKMVKHKLVSFATVVTLWTLLTWLVKLLRILLKWKYMQDKNYATCESEAILSKKFRPGYPDWGVHMGKLSSRLSRSR